MDDERLEYEWKANGCGFSEKQVRTVMDDLLNPERSIPPHTERAAALVIAGLLRHIAKQEEDILYWQSRMLRSGKGLKMDEWAKQERARIEHQYADIIEAVNKCKAIEYEVRDIIESLGTQGQLNDAHKKMDKAHAELRSLIYMVWD